MGETHDGPTTTEALLRDLDEERGRVPRRLYVDEDVHRAEIDRLFSRAWLYVAHETQIPQNGDYVRGVLGNDDVIVARGRDGQVRVLLNSCRHRGMRLCKLEEGNTNLFQCEYHGWSYQPEGRLVGVPRRKTAYFDELDTDQYGLVQARTDIYQGLIFATWWHDGPSLAEYLGPMRQYLDIVFDRVPGGVEVVKGVHKYQVPANWKILAENSSGDNYHLPSVHASAVELGLRNRPGEVGHTVHVGNGHCFGAERGGIVQGRALPTAYAEPLAEARNRLVAELGPFGEHLVPLGAGNLFPNLSLLDTVRFRYLRLRIPRAAGVTEVWGWVLVDRALSPELKAEVRRQVATFFGPSGLFEQDDHEVFSAIQETLDGYAGRHGFFSIEQGRGHETSLADRYGVELPGEMGEAYMTEANHRAFYRRWRELMEMGDGPDPMVAVDAVPDRQVDVGT